MGPTARAVWCCHHIKENFTAKFGRGLATLFWNVARAATPDQYEIALEKVRQQKPEAATYLRAIEPAFWVEAFCHAKRYGHDTSNLVESQNNGLKGDRELSILELLDSLWHRVMEKRASRRQAALQATDTARLATPFVEKALLEAKQLASSNRVQLSSPTEARVIQTNGNVFTVSLSAKECSCRHFQQNGIPCSHAVSAIQAAGGSLVSYIPSHPSSATWATIYVDPIPPINTGELKPLLDAPCFPPIARAPRGSPPKERLRKGQRRSEGVASAGRCSTCGENGHNKRKCRRPHE